MRQDVPFSVTMTSVWLLPNLWMCSMALSRSLTTSMASSSEPAGKLKEKFNSIHRHNQHGALAIRTVFVFHRFGGRWSEGQQLGQFWSRIDLDTFAFQHIAYVGEERPTHQVLVNQQGFHCITRCRNQTDYTQSIPIQDLIHLPAG